MKRYQEFITESQESELESIFNLPLEERQEIMKTLEELADLKEEGQVDESWSEFTGMFKDLFNSIKSRLKKWLGRRAISYLINLSQEDLGGKIDTLKMLDPSYFDDIDKVEAMYLGGGIDKASEDGATGWRTQIENFFGSEHIVQGENMIRLAKTGKINYSEYPKPLILNPMRNELVRTDDKRFAKIFKKWKAGELDKEKDHEDWKYWANIINKEITAPDLRIVNACDTNLVKLDPVAGAGTLGEMQVSALGGIKLFVWLDNGYQVKDISPWLIPSITKLVRSEEEVKVLLNNIKKINKTNRVSE